MKSLFVPVYSVAFFRSLAAILMIALAPWTVLADGLGNGGFGTGGGVTIMALGDSNTAAFQGGPGVRGSYRLTLQNRLDEIGVAYDMVGENYRAWDGLRDGDHQGVGGYKIEQMTANYYGAVSLYKPDYILVLAGTNNRNDPVSFVQFRDRYTQLIDMLLTASPDSQIIMSTVPRMGYGRDIWSDEYIDYLNNVAFPNMNRAIRATARQYDQIELVDLYAIMDPSTDLTDDRIHMNKYGHEKLGNLFFGALTGSAIPEPSSAAVLGLLLFTPLLQRRRRPA